MAGSLNKVTLIGNLGRDPEIKTTNNGNQLAQLSIATSQTWRDKQSGERREQTEWHRVVIFNEKLVEIVEKYLTKGAKVYIEGALKTRKWTDNAGQDRYTTEIVLQNFNGQLLMLGGGEDRPDDNAGTDPALRAPAHQRPTAASQEIDDEIPF